MTLPVGEDGILTTEICCTLKSDIWIYAFFDANGAGRFNQFTYR